jgi:FKBP-type peptidyl-prolyl cis-trans isomerase FklB
MQMKAKHIYFLAAGLMMMTFEALAQPTKPSGPAPGTAPVISVSPSPQPSFTSPPDRESLSTAFGEYYNILTTRDLQRYGRDIKTNLDVAKFIEAFSNAFVGGTPALPLGQITNLLQQEVGYQRTTLLEETEKVKASGPDNKAKATKFMEDNAKAPGVVSLPNGLQYKVVKAGDGEMPTTNNFVTMSIRATLIDGTEYLKAEHQDSDVMNPKFPPGISQALTLMKTGSKWIIYLPYELAYGERPDPFASPNQWQVPKFGPFSALIFEVDLEAVKPKPAPTQTAAPRGMPPRGMSPQGMQPAGGAPTQTQPAAARISSSEIVRVPSADEMARGSNLEVGSLEHFIQQQNTGATNAPTAK